MNGDTEFGETDGLVSIIVLSFNRKEETLECLESLMAQTYTKREVILLENASTDGSREALKAWRDRVNLVLMDRNHGDWEGRDIALTYCRGEYVLIVDNDAVIEQNCIESLHQKLQSDSNIACVQPKIVDTLTGTPYDPGFGREHADTRFYKAVFHGCVCMFRTDALREAGGFPHYLLGGAEDYISLRFHEMGLRILYEPSVTVRHLMSGKERVPFHRLQQQSRQKMRALMALAPNLLWCACVFLRAVASFSYHALRQRFYLQWLGGVYAHITSARLSLRERYPLSTETFQIYYDLKKRLTTHYVIK